MEAATEAYNTGMAEAASALARLTGRAVRVEAPRLRLPGETEAAPDDGESTGVAFRVVGQRASVFILFSDEDARRLLGLLLGENGGEAQPLSELEISAIEEVGNILVSARLNALGAVMKMSLLPSPPQLACGHTSELLAGVRREAALHGSAIEIETPFSIDAPPCGGSFFLFAAAGFLDKLLPPGVR